MGWVRNFSAEVLSVPLTLRTWISFHIHETSFETWRTSISIFYIENVSISSLFNVKIRLTNNRFFFNELRCLTKGCCLIIFFSVAFASCGTRNGAEPTPGNLISRGLFREPLGGRMSYVASLPVENESLSRRVSWQPCWNLPPIATSFNYLEHLLQNDPCLQFKDWMLLNIRLVTPLLRTPPWGAVIVATFWALLSRRE